MAWRFRLFGALRHPTEPRVLMLRSDRAYGLPRTQPSGAWVGNARVIVPAFERRLGTTLWLLRQLLLAQDETARRTTMVLDLALLETGWSPPPHARWIGRSELARVRLRDEVHRSLLDAHLDELEKNQPPAAREPWARPAWRAEVRDWVHTELARRGRRLLAIEQVKQWSISSVLRIVTDGPDLYFKASAVLPLFVNEAEVTRTLSRRFPAYVVAPLAIDGERGWMLMPSFTGLIDPEAPAEVRAEMFGRFARLQRQAAPMVRELLGDGCLDRRLEVLESQLDPLLGDPAAVARLTPEERTDLLRLAPVFKESVRRLGDLGLPPTLVHGDLHPGNVACSGGEFVYFDWTDACVAHPFIDLHSLRWEPDESVRARLLAAYLEPWEGAAAPEVLREAATVAEVVIPLHHAVSYQHLVAALEPSARPELDATHGFLREALLKAKAM